MGAVGKTFRKIGAVIQLLTVLFTLACVVYIIYGIALNIAERPQDGASVLFYFTGSLFLVGVLSVIWRDISILISGTKLGAGDKSCAGFFNVSENTVICLDIQIIVSFLIGIITVYYSVPVICISSAVVMILTVADIILVRKRGCELDEHSLKKKRDWTYPFVATYVPALILSVILLIGTMIGNDVSAEAVNSAIGGSFETFRMSDLDGNEYTEAMFKGHKVNMVNIWGTFCNPCIEEMPYLQEISDEMDPASFQIVGLVGDTFYGGTVLEDKVLEAADIVAATGAKYPMLIPSSEIYAGVIDGNIQAYPTTIFLDENGSVIKIIAGSNSKDKWIQMIEEIIADEE